MVLAASTTWYAARAGGLVAYLLLSASVAVGLLFDRSTRAPHVSCSRCSFHRVSLHWGIPRPTERST